MKHSLPVKFLAVLLCTLALLGVGASLLGLGVLASEGMLNGKTPEEVQDESLRNHAAWVAESVVHSWASNTLGDIPQEITDSWTEDALQVNFRRDSVYYTVRDASGNTLDTNYDGEAYAKEFTFQIDGSSYQKRVSLSDALPELANGVVEVPAAEETAILSEDAIEETTFPMEAAADPTDYTEAVADPTDYTEAVAEPMGDPEGIDERYVHSSEVLLPDGAFYEYEYITEGAPHCQVTVYLTEDALEEEPEMAFLTLIAAHRNRLLGLLLICGLVFAAMAVYLCSAAGHKPGTESVQPGGLNAMPLDIYGLLVLLYTVSCFLILDDTARQLYHLGLNVFLFVLGLMAFFGCLVFVSFCFACAAQCKMKDWYWLRNSMAGRFFLLGIQTVRFLIPRLRRGLIWCRNVIRQLLGLALALCRWLLVQIGRILKRTAAICGKAAERFLRLLPLTWQWLAVGSATGILITLGLKEESLLALVLAGALIVYGAHCFGTLLEAAKNMRQGELDTKVDDHLMVGSFRDFAGELNGLADVAVVAAQKQLKSERMKTELITNVSHDIKTPLTSIINYVDLLQKPHSPEEEAAYLEVLSRQSGSLKKLIEDLIEMSKATTGNIPVELSAMDAVEAVNQALGEYSGKLEAAGLTPVVRCSQESILMEADGRLVWRVISNLLSNAVKYAMTGTRLYVDVSEAQETVLISVKNISRSELNVSADELMERFVRGDSSRNTEGSGLGLNIARSLMELQHGRLELLVDGDLFKVTMVFPKAAL